MATAEAELPYDRPARRWPATRRGTTVLEPEAVYRRLGIEILKEHRATGLDRQKKAVAFSNRRRLHYYSLLLATGGTPRIPDIKGTRLSGFFVLRSLRDADAITGALSRAKAVAVIGGSFLGLEVAASLRSRGLEVHVIAPEPVLMTRVFGPEIGAFIRRRHEKSGIVFHLERTATEISGRKKVDGVTLSDGSRIAAQVVVAGVGVAPATGYLETSGLVVKGAVPVDSRLGTPDPDVFAVGDIALVPDPLTGEPRRVEHWVEAERQGRHAALGLGGIEKAYGEIPFFWTNQGDVSIKYAGYPPASSIALSFGATSSGEGSHRLLPEGSVTGGCGHGTNEGVPGRSGDHQSRGRDPAVPVQGPERRSDRDRDGPVSLAGPGGNLLPEEPKSIAARLYQRMFFIPWRNLCPFPAVPF